MTAKHSTRGCEGASGSGPGLICRHNQLEIRSHSSAHVIFLRADLVLNLLSKSAVNLCLSAALMCWNGAGQPVSFLWG